MYRPSFIAGVLCSKSRECRKSRDPKPRSYCIVRFLQAGGPDIKETVKKAINSDPLLVKAIFTEEPCLLQKVLAGLGGIQEVLKVLTAGNAKPGGCGNAGGGGVKLGPLGPDFFPGTNNIQILVPVALVNLWVKLLLTRR